MGVELAALFVILQQCYLWREASVNRALCVQCQQTLSAICDVIFLRDSGNQRCELLVVSCVMIILFKTPSTLSSYYHSWEITTCIVVSHSYEITAGIVAFISLGIQPLPIRSYSSTRDLVKPGTDCWDRYCFLTARPRRCTSPLNKYLCTFSLSVRRDDLIQNACHPLLLLSIVGDRHMYCDMTSLMR